MRALKSGLASEDMINAAVMDWAKAKKVDNFVIHIPNEGKRSFGYGKKLKQLGMRPGVSDLFVCMPKHSYHGAWIEIKSDEGRMRPEQMKFHEDMMKQNYYTRVTWGLDDTLLTLEWYCFHADNVKLF